MVINSVLPRSLLIVAVCLLVACSSAPQRNFATYELLITQEAMPENWEQIEYEKMMTINEGQEDGSYITFQEKNIAFFARAVEYIYRYSNRTTANFHYERFKKEYLEKTFYDLADWQTPPDFQFQSKLAENWRFACAPHQEILKLDSSSTSVRCRYLAQYAEFLVDFTIRQEADGQSRIPGQNAAAIHGNRPGDVCMQTDHAV